MRNGTRSRSRQERALRSQHGRREQKGCGSARAPPAGSRRCPAAWSRRLRARRAASPSPTRAGRRPFPGSGGARGPAGSLFSTRERSGPRSLAAGKGRPPLTVRGPGRRRRGRGAAISPHGHLPPEWTRRRCRRQNSFSVIRSPVRGTRRKGKKRKKNKKTASRR